MKQAVRWLCVLLGVFVSSIGVAHAAVVAAGIQHTVYVSPDGQVWTWGHNYSGQLGLGTDASNGIYASPMPVPGMSDVKAVAAGDYSTFVLKNDGTVWAWGANGGLLGGGSLPNEFAPVQVTGLSNIVEIAAGSFFTMALAADGTVWVWGDNSFGQLGNGNTSVQSVPISIAGFAGATAIDGGGAHSAVVQADGTVWASGTMVSVNLAMARKPSGRRPRR
jgi:alpha-tubulin suppressor-like RCC1 family protein